MRSTLVRATFLRVAVSLWGGLACSQSALNAPAVSGADGSSDGASDAGGAADAPAAEAPVSDAGKDFAPDLAADIADSLPSVDESPPDECKVDGDCPARPDGGNPDYASRCARASDGHRRCVVTEVCSPDPHLFEGCCFIDEDCTKEARGHCIPGAQCWGGGPQPPHEGHCAYDECASDAECIKGSHGLCNSGAPRTCHYGPCTTNADCNKKSGGACVRHSDDVCGAVDVYCHYPDAPCLTRKDCKGDGGPDYFWECVPTADQQGTMCLYDPPRP
jgi:hypothetical protein